MSAGAALRAIAREQTTGRAGTHAALEQTTVQTPEVRLVREHYRAMGLDDIKRVVRSDPAQHLFGCRCVVCDREERPCSYDRCGAVLKGYHQLAMHLERHKKEAVTTRRLLRERLEPAGLGFVQAMLADPERASTLNVETVRLFEEKILAASGGRRLRRTQALRTALTAALAEPDGTTKVGVNGPNSVMTVVLRLAIVAGVSPNAAALALMSWGIERFADDVRKARSTGEIYVAKALAEGTAPTPNSAAFPSGEDETLC